MSDFNDTLGAGSYPEPEYYEKDIIGKIVITYDLDASIPSNWNYEDTISNIKESLNDYIDLSDYKDIEIELDMKDEE